MAPRSVRLVALALLLVVAVPAMAVNFDVGDSSGWTNGGSYDSWVAGNSFSAGDTLTFKYDPTHSVVQVPSKVDYDSCNTASALLTESRSPTKVTLDKADTTYYFVCGTPSHCAGGMKLSLTTAAAGGGSTPSTPTTPSSPSTPTTPSKPPATPSTSPPAPSTKSAAGPAITSTAAAVAGILAAAAFLA